MIQGIRRKLTGVDDPRWDVDSVMETHEEETPTPFDAYPEPNPPEHETAVTMPGSTEKTIAGDTSYYHRFIEACIESGGRFGDHKISMGWLRTILAGLEGRNLGPDAMWEAESRDSDAGVPTREPRYSTLFRTPSGPSNFDFP